LESPLQKGGTRGGKKGRKAGYPSGKNWKTLNKSAANQKGPSVGGKFGWRNYKISLLLPVAKA